MNTTAAAQTTEITMKKVKDCKHVVRYEADKESDAEVDNVYLSKTFAKPMPEEIIVTVRAGD